MCDHQHKQTITHHRAAKTNVVLWTVGTKVMTEKRSRVKRPQVVKVQQHHLNFLTRPTPEKVGSLRHDR